MAGKRKTPKRKIHKTKGGGYALPSSKFNPDSLFTMVLSCETFLVDNLKKSGIKVDRKVVLEKISAAVMDCINPKLAEQPVYNIAADAIAAGYISFRKGDKKASRQLVNLAFQSPDCEMLLNGLVAINEGAVGTKLVADDMGDDDDDDSSDTDTPEEDDDTTDVTDMSGENAAADTSDTDEESDDSSTVSASYAKIVKKLKRSIKAASDDYAIQYGIDGPNGDTSNTDDLGIMDDIDSADELLEVETLGETNDIVPDTMRLGRITPINDLVGVYPDNLPKIDMLSSEEVAVLAKEHPDAVTIANKIGILGDYTGLRLATKFLRKAQRG